MLNELENKIRKAIPELEILQGQYIQSYKPIQLNHVLMYLNSLSYTIESWTYRHVLRNFNLKSNLLSDQSEDLIKYLNEL